jgi:pimeloyl-ACP methyl ester carboxylesterase
MKKIVVSLILILTLVGANSQDISGTWLGAIKIQGVELRLVFSIVKSEMGYVSTMDSPDQGVIGIPVKSTQFLHDTLIFKLDDIGIVYTGVFENENTCNGIFKQRNQSFELVLAKSNSKSALTPKTQEPAPPFPYETETITFYNARDNISLAGTFTFPKTGKNFPTVVLISGSGPQNRDEELLGHKPFFVLADYLSRKGIAVLRFDDRGTAESEGNFQMATSLDFSHDVEAALAYLKTRNEVNVNQLGLIGHSEGGLIAPMVAANHPEVRFMVLLAGPGMQGYKLLNRQQELIAKASGFSPIELENALKINRKAMELVVASATPMEAAQKLNEYLPGVIQEISQSLKPGNIDDGEYINQQISQLTSPWMMYFLKYNPIPVLEKTRCAVLALNGAKDLQVPASENLLAIEQALMRANNKDYTIKELPGLNHLFQHCETGLPMEYAGISETFSTEAMQIISDWILKEKKHLNIE